MSRVRWVWDGTPDEELLEVARHLAERGPPPGAEQIRDKRSRRVWRAPEVAGGLLIKHFTVRSYERLLYALRRSGARREFEVMVAMARQGLPTVRALGYGERRVGPALVEAWFLGRLVPAARMLSELLEESVSVEYRHRLARQALDTVAALHAQPWRHNDLHAENLIRGREGPMLLTDLHSVDRVARVTPRIRAANLAVLFFSMRRFISLDAVPELLRDYADHTGAIWDELVPRVRRALERRERQHLENRSIRCLRSSSLFAAERLGSWRVFRSRDYERQELQADLEHPGDEVLGAGPRGEVVRVGSHVLKHYRSRGVLGRFRQRLGLGRARSAWLAARRLDVRSIPTPKALALVEVSDGTAVLVTRNVSTFESLRTYVERLEGTPADPERRHVGYAVGHLTGRLVRAGLRHHDLSTKNLLIVPERPPSSRDVRTEPDPSWPTVSLIDLDNLRLTRPWSEAAAERMLGQLGDVPAWITRTDRLRFLRGYESSSGRSLGPALQARIARRVRRRQARRRALQAARA